MKKIFAISLLAFSLSGCGGDEQDAFDFAKKEITASTPSNEAVEFKDLKLVRVVKSSDGTSKGIVCGSATRHEQFAGYKDFAVFYKTEAGVMSGKINYVLTDKILPGQDDKTAIMICQQ
ncbi:hypothetical protein [Serratia marcescens]|uniref:hypothetical protein n=1 Tax=Serratia marcescens TaxID=615 RepID=UPI0025AACC61|nr:hypothetical protein [Serratia marcescens]MDN0031122.1 hypothetical protein [Serratia marcescens]